MSIRKIIIFQALMLIGIFSLAAGDFQPLKERTVEALKIGDEVKIDGVLEESCWCEPSYSDFVQSDPLDGTQPTEKTVVWVRYDDRALYVAARLYDSDPEKIISRLGRRDDRVESDWFSFAVDSYFDRLSGFYFAVNPAGSIRDAVLFNDQNRDFSWDGVWSWAARIDGEGWTVEAKIPYDQLRFPRKEEYVWGIFFSREIKRKNESNNFLWIPKDESGYVSRFAKLVGIHNIRPPRHIEILPYSVGQARFRSSEARNPFNTGRDYAANFGLDAKLGLSTNLTLDLTANPDFGQVEVDPAVLNLTAFETFYEEKRPFFVEGASIFQFGRGIASMNFGFNWGSPSFFYSRRIGRAPQGYASHSGYTDFPDRTHILSAAKLSGKVASGWSLGFLNAITSREWAQVDSSGQRFKDEVEPLTYYGVLRSVKEFNEGRQGLGLMTTAVIRDLEDPVLEENLNRNALALAFDGWTYLDKNKKWVLNGWFGGTQVHGTRESIFQLQHAPQHYFQRPDTNHVHLDEAATSMQGWAARFALNKQQGNVLFNAALGAISPGFEVNDIGFNVFGDMINAHLATGYMWFTPGKVLRSWNVLLATFRTYDFGKHKTGDGYFLFGEMEFLNYWRVDINAMYIPQRWNNTLTRGGPLVLSLPHKEIDIEIESDSRNPIVVGVSGEAGKTESGSYQYSGELSLRWKPRSNISIEVSPGYSREFSVAQWVMRKTDPLQSGTYGTRYVFGEINQDLLSSSIRINWIFSPKLSLQMYLQPFIAVGKFSRFKELARARTFDFNVFGEGGSDIAFDSGFYTVDPDGPGPAAPFSFYNPDFNFKSLRGTLLFRWEYTPGSTLYLVWTQNRQDFANPGEFRFGRDLGLMLSAPGDNVFLVKVTYRWNM